MKNRCLASKIMTLVNRSLTGHKFQLGGSIASAKNSTLIKQSIFAWLLLPVESAKISDESKLLCQYGHCLNCLKTYDFMDILEYLDKTYRILISGDDYYVFKAHTRSILWPVISPISSVVFSWYSDRTDYRSLRHACTFCRFLQKLPFDRQELEDSALADFLESERRMRDLDLTGNPYVSELHKIIYEWCKDWHGNLLPVRHGTGAVAEGSLSKAEKYFHLGLDTILKYHITKKVGDPGIYFPFASCLNNTFERVAKVKFVPKSAKKLRTICMEPATLQYFQQGVMRLMYDYISKHNYLKDHIQLADQRQNREGARLGSNTNSYCTLDLSAASDSVSWELVRQLFKGTEYLTWAYVTRSTHNLLPDGTLIESAKFAPMGSALCFPTECLIFCSVVELVARRHTRFSDNYVYYSVYGDDIICPSSWAPEVMEVLSSIGFIVNKEKSYWDGPFRESCGKEYYLGHDITPLYYRIKGDILNLDPGTYSALCSAANNAAEKGFLVLRSYYIEKLMSSRKINLKPGYPKLPLFVDSLEYSPHLFSDNPTNFHLKRRKNVDLNTCEYSYLSLASRRENSVPVIVNDTITYFEWLVQRDFCHDHVEPTEFTANQDPTRLCWNKTRATSTYIDMISWQRKEDVFMTRG